MSDIEWRLTDYKKRLLRGEPREWAWSDTFGDFLRGCASVDNQLDPAVPMTKAEITKRRLEAKTMYWNGVFWRQAYE